MKASNTAAGDAFGHVVAIHGSSLIAGAPGEDGAATGTDGDQTDNTAASSGSAYLFGRTSGQWNQYAYLKASNTGAGDEFGRALALSAGIAVAGAARESGNAIGINGLQANNLASWSGAAYIFDLPVLGQPEIEVWHGAAEFTDAGAGLSLGPVAAGSSFTFTLHVRNKGSEVLLPGTPVVVGADAGLFALDTENLPGELADGQEGWIDMTFGPSSAGTFQAAFQLPSNDADESPFVIPLTATAMGAADLYAGWAADQGLDGPLAEAAARPFRDGVENLLKYAFNLDGRRADVRRLVPGSGTAGLPSFRLVEAGGGPVLRAEYLRRRGSGLAYAAKVSTTLHPGSFVPMGGTETTAEIDAAWERVTVDQPSTPATTPRIFGVVEVTMP